MGEVSLLAILQGIAEFLPISSSGHLVLGRQLLGMQDAGLRLDVFLHVGTILSIVCFYFAVIRRIVVNCEWSYLFKVAVSAIPVGVVGLVFKDDLEAVFANPKFVGGALIFTGLVLTMTRFLPKGDREVSVFRAIVMGLAQAVAIIPGVSRSGMTLAAARAVRVDAGKSAEFSFLMSAPPIVGAALLEVVKGLKAPAACTHEVSWPLVIYGGVLAAVVGYLSLKILVRSLKGRWFWLFGPYCLLAGLATIIMV